MEPTSSTSSSASRSTSSAWLHMFLLNSVDEKIYKRCAKLKSLLDLPRFLTVALTKVVISGRGKNQVEDLMMRIDRLFYTIRSASSLGEITYDVNVACNVLKSVDEIVDSLRVTSDSVYNADADMLEKMCSDALEFKRFLEQAQKGVSFEEYMIGLCLVIMCDKINEFKDELDEEDD